MLRRFLPLLLLAGGTCALADETLLPISPPIPTAPDESSNSVQWAPLFRQSLFFLGVEHGFRVAFDKDTQAGLGGKYFSGYWSSVSNLHGWADGDPFVVNYVGHPMQGAIAGDIWIHNDPKYRDAEFGKNRQYWTGRLRALAFAWAYSEQFEIGPLSEASIGHIQSKFPQQGFVDHVITPTVGTGWLIAEDMIDHYVIRRIEASTTQRWVHIVARGFLNPGRTFANCMEWEHPWNREVRYLPASHATFENPRRAKTNDDNGVPNFEFAINAVGLPLSTGGGVRCAGGGASGTFNLTSAVALEGDISGCKMLGLSSNVSGDSMLFAAGPKFTYRGAGRLTPWMHLLVGAEKDSQEVLFPDVKEAVLADPPKGLTPHQLHDLYTKSSNTTGFAVEIGGGLDWAVNRNLALRMGDVDYVQAFLRNDQAPHPPDLRVTMGVVLRVGD